MTDAITKLRTIRDGLAGVTELLLAILDDIDGDENIEDPDEDQAVDDNRCDEADSGDDEPSISALGSYINGQLEYDLELDRSDDEPSLGWTTSGALVGDDDREFDPAELGEPEECE